MEKLHFGETLEDAAHREVLEETGININKESLKLISVANDIVEDAHFVTIGFLYKNPEGEPKGYGARRDYRVEMV